MLEQAAFLPTHGILTAKFDLDQLHLTSAGWVDGFEKTRSTGYMYHWIGHVMPNSSAK